MDTEIVDYQGDEYSLQTFCHAPNSVLFSMNNNSSSSEHLQEMGLTNTSVSDVGPTSQTKYQSSAEKPFPSAALPSKCFTASDVLVWVYRTF
jgi:hypothetical protein